MSILDHETVAGLAHAHRVDVPEGGDRIDTAVLPVLAATDTQIERVRIERTEPDDL